LRANEREIEIMEKFMWLLGEKNSCRTKDQPFNFGHFYDVFDITFARQFPFLTVRPRLYFHQLIRVVKNNVESIV